MAATATSSALKRLDLRDPAALFETHGAEEIRGLERQVRAEIEHKKEELRQMVGERYRDLIEAADTIGQMRRCAEGLVDAVKATDEYCARLRQPAAPRPPREPQVSPGPRSLPAGPPPRSSHARGPAPSPRPRRSLAYLGEEPAVLVAAPPREDAGRAALSLAAVGSQRPWAVSSGVSPDFRALSPSPYPYVPGALPA